MGRTPLGNLKSTKIYLISPSWLILALLAALLAHLGALEPHLIAKLLQDGANMPQHSAKMNQLGLQDRPQDREKPPKVMNCRRFFGFRHFWQDRAQDPTKVAKMLQKVRQVGNLAPQVGHLGHILAPSWPTWRHLGAKMRPNSHPNGPPDALQIASWAILAPRGSPRSSKVPLEPQFPTISVEFSTEFDGFFKQLSSISSRKFRHGGGLSRVAHWICINILHLYLVIYL